MGEASNPWEGLVRGALGGAAGLLAMDAYWRAVTRLSRADPRMQPRKNGALASLSLIGQHHREGEAATAALGRIVYRCVTGHDPHSGKLRAALSTVVHWTVSMGLGGVYGAVRGRASSVDVAGGLLFGTAVWLFGDELFNPLVGLAKGPTAYPAVVHVHALGAHVVYGLTTSAVTQMLRRLF